MSNKQTKMHSYPNTSSLHHDGYCVNDGMSLVDLYKTIRKESKNILIITLIAIILSIAYAFHQPTIYQSNVILLKPLDTDVYPIRTVPFISMSKEVRHDVSLLVFERFRNNLSSRTLQKEFIKKYNISETLYPYKTNKILTEKEIDKFSKLFKVVFDKNRHKVNVFLNYINPEFTAKWLNLYIEFVNTKTVKQIKREISNAINHKIIDIKSNIGLKKEMAKLHRQDQLSELREKFMALNSLDKNNTNTNTDSLEYISARIKVLESRVSDEPFINGFRELQEELKRLNFFDIEAMSINSVFVDKFAHIPENHIKPKRKLIVSIGFVIGLIIGIFYALFKGYYLRIKSDY